MLTILPPELRNFSTIVGSGKSFKTLLFTLEEIRGEGVSILVKCDQQLCRVWFAQEDWDERVTLLLAVSNIELLAPELIFALCDELITPLKSQFMVEVVMEEMPHQCTLLPQWAVCCTITLADSKVQAVLIDWPVSALAHAANQWSALPLIDATDVARASSSAQFHFYAYIILGWCQLTISELHHIESGDGLRVQGALSTTTRRYWLQLATATIPQIIIGLKEKYQMKIEHITNEEAEELLTFDKASELNAMPDKIKFDALPQTLIFELGRVKLPYGDLRQLKIGDTLSYQHNEAYSEVLIRCQGQPVGTGSLVQCGDELLVKITKWYLISADTASSAG